MAQTITLPLVKSANVGYFKASRAFGDKSHELVYVKGQVMLLTIQHRELYGDKWDWHYQINEFHDDLTVGKSHEYSGNTYENRKDARDAADAYLLQM